MGKKRRDDETPDATMSDGDAPGNRARWIGNVHSAPERKQPADTEAADSDAVEEQETYDGGRTAEPRDPGR